MALVLRNVWICLISKTGETHSLDEGKTPSRDTRNLRAGISSVRRWAAQEGLCAHQTVYTRVTFSLVFCGEQTQLLLEIKESFPVSYFASTPTSYGKHRHILCQLIWRACNYKGKGSVAAPCEASSTSSTQISAVSIYKYIAI